MAGGRVPFSEADDKNLAQYIANYHPDISGRSGNRIYEDLVEKKGREWKWTRQHPWRSWRERYIKHKETFDPKIMQILKENTESAATVSQKEPEKQDVTGMKRKHSRPSGGTPAPKKRLKINPGSDKTTTPKKPQKEESEEGEPPEQQENPVRDDDQRGEREKNENENEKSRERQAIHAAKDDGAIDQRADQGLNAEHAMSEDIGNEGEGDAPIDSDDYDGEVFSDTEEEEPETIQTVEIDELDPDTPKGQTNIELPQDEINAELRGSVEMSSQICPDVSPRGLPGIVSSGEGSRSHMVEQRHDKTTALPEFNETGRSGTARKSGVAKSRRPALSQEDDPFRSSPTPTPTPENIFPLVSKRRLPVLVDGPFGTTFAGRGINSRVNDDSDDSTDKQWPPNRRRKDLREEKQTPIIDRKGKGREEPCQEAPTTQNYKTTNAAKPDGPPLANSKALQKTTTPRQANAVASSSRMLVDTPESRPPTPGPPSSTSDPNESVHKTADSHIRPHVTNGKSRDGVHPEQPNIFGKPSKKLSSSVIIQPDVPSIHSRNNNILQNGIENSSGKPVMQRIDLRQEMMSSRKARLSRASRSSSSIPRRLSLSLPVEEQEMLLGQAIRSISENMGFTESVVWNVFRELKSITVTEDSVRRMRDKANEEIQRIIAQAREAEGSQTETPDTDNEVPHTNGAPPSKNPQKSKRNSFHIRSIPPFDDKQVMAYTPPSKSRAGQYSRLKYQGKETEAREREHRRSSGARFVPLPESVPDSSPTYDAHVRKAKEQIMVGDAVVETKEVEPLVTAGPNPTFEWRKEHDELLANARAENAEALHDLERAVDRDFLVRWMASHHGNIAKSAVSTAIDNTV